MAYACCVFYGSAKMPLASSDQTPGSFAKSWRNCECVYFIAKLLRVHFLSASELCSGCSDNWLLFQYCWVSSADSVLCCLCECTECVCVLKTILCNYCIKLLSIWKLFDLIFITFVVVLCRDLSFNHLTRLEETAFVGLGLLESLNLGENSIRHLGEGVFSGLASLRIL